MSRFPASIEMQNENKAPTQNIQSAFIAPVGKDGTIVYKSFYKSLSSSKVKKLLRGESGGAGTITVSEYIDDLLEPIAPENIRVEPVK